MRAFFLLLVLANLGFFAWANFYSEADKESDPAPLTRQVAPEKLRVLPATAAAKPPPVAAKPAAETAAAPASANGTCTEWGAFAGADVARAGEALAGLALGTRLTQRQVDESASWWVYFPPRPNRPEAQKKADELKRLGIEEFYIVPDEGPYKFAVSLGVFKTEAAANNRLEALRARGVKTAQVGARESAVQKTYFQVRAADEALVSKLREFAKGFAGSEVRNCPS